MSEDFGERLRTFRKYKNLTLAELGKPIGKTPTTLSDWERGRTRPTLEQIEQLAEILECDAAKLAFGVSRFSQNPQSGTEIKIEEYLEGYGRKPVDEDLPNSSVIFDPKWREGESKPPTTVRQVLEHLQPWLDATKRDPNVAPIMLHLLRKHLPHSDLEDFG